MPMKPKQMVRLLKKNGFVEVSQSGSHLKMCNMINGRIVIVPIHPRELKKGTEESILKQAGLKE